MKSADNPRMAILLAAHNGKPWIARQVNSILAQDSVDISLFMSVDLSDDGTEQLVTQLASRDSRIFILPHGRRFGNAGRNFYRLIQDVDFSEFDYIAFSDQDDIWNSNKLCSHIALLEQHHAEAVSSNVIAFWPDGHEKLINKSQPQRAYDFLFESAGPGCTFLMTPWLVNQIKQQLLSNPIAAQVELHDWLSYAICRAHNKTWVIDSIPSMRYRQHQHNVVGANSGWKAALARIKKIQSGWYRHQVHLIAKVAASIQAKPEYIQFVTIMDGNRFGDQFRLLSYAIQGRRKLLDRLILISSILFFIF